MEGLKGIVEVKGEEVKILDEEKLREKVIDQLVWESVFGDEKEKRFSRWLIRNIGVKLGIYPASIYPLYKAIGEGKIKEEFTVPAINIRGMSYDIARAIFRAMKELNSKAVIFEIAKSEISYTFQRPDEYAVVIISAGIKEGYKGPVFIQGDHFQFNLKRFKEDPEKETSSIKELTKEAILAGFFNIDIDASTLVDLEKDSLDEQQKLNYEKTAELISFIREIEPKGITISIGGEIGEVGGKNSTPEEFIAFMEGLLKKLRELKGEDCIGISKISVQTGTTHGGIPLPDGSIAKVNLDFEVLRSITEIGRERYKIAGTVQHGASTLPEELFHKFPEAKAVEIHLATQFQNMFYEHPSLPAQLRERIYNWIRENLKDERKSDWSDKQFIYKLRKKGWGPFKKEIWSLPEEIKTEICKDLEEKFKFLFKELKVKDSGRLIERYIKQSENLEEFFSKREG